MTNRNAENVAKLAAQAADEKKADEIRVLKMPDVVAEAEFFVISSASTHVQVRAIVESIRGALEDAGEKLLRYEGRGGDNCWVLLDYGDVVVHVFLEEVRDYYNLEKLWADAKQVKWYE